MYCDHVPPIAAAMRADADTFARGCTFVVLTIRQMITQVPRQMADVEANGIEARSLFGFKREAYRYIQEHKVNLWYQMTLANNAAEAIQVIAQVPGLGIVKGAFVAQLMGFDVACLDSRNADREGRSRTQYKAPSNAKAFARKVAEYVAETAGRAREYWDLWCEDVAHAYKRTAQDISAIHLTCIVH